MKNKMFPKIAVTVLNLGIICFSIYEIIKYRPTLFYLIFPILYCMLSLIELYTIWFKADEYKITQNTFIHILLAFVLIHMSISDFESDQLMEEWDQSLVTEEMMTEIIENSEHADEEIVYIEPAYDYGYIITYQDRDLTVYQLDQEKITNEKQYTFDQPITIIQDTIWAIRLEEISFMYTIENEKYAFSYSEYRNITKNQYLGKTGEESTEEFAKNLFEFTKRDQKGQLLCTCAIEGESQYKGAFVYTEDNSDYYYSSIETIIVFYDENGMTYTIECAADYPTAECSMQYSDHRVTVGPMYVGRYYVMRTYEINNNSIELSSETRLESE